MYNPRRRTKYGAKKVHDGELVFDSAREYRRWQDLKAAEAAGVISNLQRQVKFVLIPAQREPDIEGPRGGIQKGRLIERECSYVADFVYNIPDKIGPVVEDAKGVRTAEYIIKRKLMLHVHGIRIKEV